MIDKDPVEANDLAAVNVEPDSKNFFIKPNHLVVSSDYLAVENFLFIPDSIRYSKIIWTMKIEIVIYEENDKVKD